MKSYPAMIALAACLASPPIAAQIFSWDPLKDVENALPQGAPNEGKIIQARHQVREMAQDALATLFEVAPGARRVIDKSAGYAVFSTFRIKSSLPAARPGKAWSSTSAPIARLS